MFYQNNNDYMRDAFYYSVPQNSTYQNGCAGGYMPMNNMQTQMLPTATLATNTMGNNMIPQQNMQRTSVSSMYPQVYRIINPVANRVISNSNCQYVTEDTLDNMVDAVYNIVEGDVSTLSTTFPTNTSDDTVTQGPSRGNTHTGTTSTTNSSNANSRQNSVIETTRSTTTTVMNQNSNRGQNQLLRDLIKIIIIKELLSRQRSIFGIDNTSSFTGFSNGSNNFFDPRIYGLI